MSMTVKDVIKWLKTLSADDATLMSENDPDAYLEVGGFQEEPDTTVSPRYNDKMEIKVGGETYTYIYEDESGWTLAFIGDLEVYHG